MNYIHAFICPRIAMLSAGRYRHVLRKLYRTSSNHNSKINAMNSAASSLQLAKPECWPTQNNKSGPLTNIVQLSCLLNYIHEFSSFQMPRSTLPDTGLCFENSIEHHHATTEKPVP
jgi:hypothetical protein